MDLTCCVDENQASAGATDTGGDTDATDTDDSDGRVLELPDCTPELEGQLGCTSPDPEAPEATMQCVGGQWVEYAQDMQCQMDGDDFAYGCVLMDQAVQVLCGKGAGQPVQRRGTSVHRRRHAASVPVRAGLTRAQLHDVVRGARGRQLRRERL